MRKRPGERFDGDDIFILNPNIVYVDNGGGLDTVLIDALREDATIRFDGFGKPRLKVPGDTPEVILANVERIEFNDGTLALDRDGYSGQAFRLYQASFDRKPDMQGLDFWTAKLDTGSVSLLDAATAFLRSAEFATAYGDHDMLRDADFIDLLYENVLNRAPDEAGYAFWNEMAEQDVSRGQMLVFFSESEENKTKVAPAIDDGIWFS